MNAEILARGHCAPIGLSGAGPTLVRPGWACYADRVLRRRAEPLHAAHRGDFTAKAGRRGQVPGRRQPKSQIAAGTPLPLSGRVFISANDANKPRVTESARRFVNLGLRLAATTETGAAIARVGLPVKPLQEYYAGARRDEREREAVTDLRTAAEASAVFGWSQWLQNERDRLLSSP